MLNPPTTVFLGREVIGLQVETGVEWKCDNFCRERVSLGGGGWGAKKSSRFPRPHNFARPMRHGNALTAKAWGDAVQGLVGLVK